MDFKRYFGFWTCTALVVGNMIGSGIFLLPSALGHYGGISILGWLFTACGAILLSLVFVGLSRNTPRIGGPYVYAKAEFGNFSGFIVAYGYWISILTGNAAISVALVGYLSIFVPVLSSSPILGALAALANLWLLTFINVLGVKISGRVQIIFTILKITPLLLIAAYGIFYFEPGNFEPFNLSHQNHFSAITTTATLTLWAFLGLESATIPANNIKNPEKMIPRATVAGTLIATFVYIFATISVMGVISPGDLVTSSAPFADAAERLLGSYAGFIIAAAGAFACFGALNGWILLQGQMPLAVALDNLFPKKFATISKTGTPAFGIIFSSVLVSCLLLMNFDKGLVEKFTFIILLATLATLVPYLLSTLARLKYIYSTGSLKTIILSSIIPALAFLYSVWAVIGLGIYTILWGLVLLSTGIPVYLRMKQIRS